MNARGSGKEEQFAPTESCRGYQLCEKCPPLLAVVELSAFQFRSLVVATLRDGTFIRHFLPLSMNSINHFTTAYRHGKSPCNLALVITYVFSSGIDQRSPREEIPAWYFFGACPGVPGSRPEREP